MASINRVIGILGAYLLTVFLMVLLLKELLRGFC